MAEAKVVALKGAPQSKASVGKKSIYRWPDMEVTLVEGKVEQVKFRDAATEKRNAAERARANSQQKSAASQGEFESKRAQGAAKRAATSVENAAGNRLERIVTLQAYVQRLERELAEDSKRSSFGKGPPPMSAEARALLTLRIENARAEIAGLK